MFEIGFWELALLAVLGLVVLGPEKLPKVAAQLGRYAGQARRMARTLTAQIRDELEAEERRIMARESTADRSAPAQPTYNRPGADDLIPGTTSDAAVTPNMTTADESADTAHRPQP
ncbi:MAG: Sec-independent protein translocase protein TatB [Gammaproteobacteria bacterium]|nr:Sec-independent protein translocase protein TatB [Gammaproteobacteria bacterium]